MAFDNTDALMGLLDEAAELGPDMNVAVAGGGGERELPPEGPVRLRLRSYIETGIHLDTVNGTTKKKEFVILEFECSGKNHPVRESDEQPHLIQLKLSKSLNEKAWYYKLFKRLNHDGKAKHFAQLIGKAFKGKVIHNSTGEGEAKRTYANLKDKTDIHIFPAFYENEEGESLPLPVEPMRLAPRVFLWDAPKGLKEMWDSIFIDGTYEVKGKEGEDPKQVSKNYFQDTIRKAVNFKGSPIAVLLGTNGEEPDIPGAEVTERTEANVERSKDAAAGASDDPLANM